MAGIYGGLMAVLAVLMFRVWDLGRGELLAQAAARQSSYRLEVTQTRGKIYDRNLTPMTGGEWSYLAAVVPSPQSLEALTPLVTGENREALSAGMEGGTPFLIPVTQYAEGLPGVEIFPVEERYAKGLAVHLLGYRSGDGTGQSGIEAAFDRELSDWGGDLWVRFSTDALGRALGDGRGESAPVSPSPPGGVVLTLDSSVQQAAQEAMADNQVDKGACVVMDCKTGDLLAMVSTPAFDPDNVAASLEDEDAPLLNRALQAYSVGSSFKLAVAAAALEKGISPIQQEECLGAVEVDGQLFRCHNLAGHGLITMEEAIKRSCNPYFVQLAQQTGAAQVRQMAADMGFGSPCRLAEGITSAAGNLTSLEELVGGEFANFAFGQGKLTATPLQIAVMTASVANGGERVIPRLVEGTTQDGSRVEETVPYARQRIMSEGTAQILQAFMVSVVEEGSGTPAKPSQGGAGGKTASAQTGRIDPATGQEVVHAWFTGFYPAQEPRYVITVLVEGGESGSDRAAPVFRQIADALPAAEN